MKVVIGVDEAGYGPTLGPFVIGLTALRVEQGGSAGLYHRLAPLVGRSFDSRGGKLPVDDSKKLYSFGASLAPLELTALTFLAAGRCLPTRLEELLSHPGGGWPRWYSRPERTPELPRATERAVLEEWHGSIHQRLARRGVELLSCRTRAVLEEEFNESLAHTGNKAATLLEFLVPLLEEHCREHADADLEVQVDRLGGRRYYMPLLGALFPFRPVRIVQESKDRSAYEVRDGGRTVTLSFETKSDGRHLPVALSSMCAKYVREVFLTRLNAHFGGRVRDLEPTAGYPVDAQRFLEQIDMDLRQDERPLLVRER
jgi:hypothetical protein